MSNAKNNEILDKLKKLFASVSHKYPSFIDDLFNLIKELQKARQQKFTFLMVGRTGVGKSSTINSLFGEKIAPEGKYDPTTMEVKSYEHQINNIKFTIIDTPGLCDDIPESKNDEKYIKLIKRKVKQIDSLWFVTRLDESRVTRDEIQSIKIISEAFTVNVWNYAVIIFTCAGKADDYLVDLKERTKRIRKAIAKYTGDKIANNIPAIAVDNKSKTLTTPDGKRWLEELYTKVFKRMTDRSAAPFFLATSQRIKSKSNANQSDKDSKNFSFNEEQKTSIKNKLFTAIPILEKIGGAIGSLFGGSIGKSLGESIGGLVGHGIDAIFSLFF
ncbi:MAG: 50S ribosome-binding GTPase [Goleter apudmare HA4340-LM2]|jgi:tRNA U34 5-carboxymethylaminomethyl modifying GTPase MnmE/TrmE|nr:50S ribosome-binding GTPase [Goleter apudmare HA4340-LM2]